MTRGARGDPQREQRDEQQDELNPPRDDQRGRRRGRQLGSRSASASTVGLGAIAAPRIGSVWPVALSFTRADRSSLGARVSDARILFCGDLVGPAGRRALLRLLPALRERHDPTFVVVNGENVAGGFGITPEIADELLAAGVDVITLGNHAYRHREIYPYLDAQPRILRPANYLHGQPGHGHCVVERDGVRSASSTCPATSS